MCNSFFVKFAVAACCTICTIATAASQCDAVLRPNQEQYTSDYAITQSYMYQSAAYEYDRLQKIDNSARSADASYKLFSAEYEDSSSREDFQERIRQRLSRESFNMSASQARAISRIFVTDSQVAAWASCIEAAGGGAVLIVASNPNASAFAIKISFLPPTGVGNAKLLLSVDGARIEGKSSIAEEFLGKSSRAYIAKPIQGNKRVVITANISGLSDDLSIDLTPRVKYTPPEAPPLPAPPAVEKLNPLFVGQTPDCNAAIVTNHQGHLNCVNVPLGYTIKHGPTAHVQLYLGQVPNINASAVTTNPNFRNGATIPWGHTIRDANKPSGATPLYVVVGCGNNDGEVTTNPAHKNCATTSIGWAYPL